MKDKEIATVLKEMITHNLEWCGGAGGFDESELYMCECGAHGKYGGHTHVALVNRNTLKQIIESLEART